MKPTKVKRKLIAGSLLLLFGLSHVANGQSKTAPKPKKDSTVKENRTCPVCPPGGGGIAAFNKDCIACSLCINVCPNVYCSSLQTVRFSRYMQPVMIIIRAFALTIAQNALKFALQCVTSSAS